MLGRLYQQLSDNIMMTTSKQNCLKVAKAPCQRAWPEVSRLKFHLVSEVSQHTVISHICSKHTKQEKILRQKQCNRQGHSMGSSSKLKNAEDIEIERGINLRHISPSAVLFILLHRNFSLTIKSSAALLKYECWALHVLLWSLSTLRHVLNRHSSGRKTTVTLNILLSCMLTNKVWKFECKFSSFWSCHWQATLFHRQSTLSRQPSVLHVNFGLKRQALNRTYLLRHCLYCLPTCLVAVQLGQDFLVYLDPPLPLMTVAFVSSQMAAWRNQILNERSDGLGREDYFHFPFLLQTTASLQLD